MTDGERRHVATLNAAESLGQAIRHLVDAIREKDRYTLAEAARDARDAADQIDGLIARPRGNPWPCYDPDFGDGQLCDSCGHSYERHFDSWEPGYHPVGCKYCQCHRFAEKGSSGPPPVAPCPECGALPEVADTPDEEGFYYVHCRSDDCPMESRWDRSRTGAIVTWNQGVTYHDHRNED